MKVVYIMVLLAAGAVIALLAPFLELPEWWPTRSLPIALAGGYIIGVLSRRRPS